MNEHQQKLIGLLHSKAKWPAYHIEFRGSIRVPDHTALTKILVELGEQSEHYFLRLNGPNCVRYFKRRRLRMYED